MQKAGAQERAGDRVFRVHGAQCEYIASDPGHDPRRPIRYSSNRVTTSYYTWYDFIPRNLFEQFSNLANLYFLLIGIFQIIPQISTTNGVPTIFQPLAFIVVVSAVRAAKEDWDRHKADNARNSFPYEIMADDGTFQAVPSGSLKPGHLIKVYQNSMVPADILLLGSSHEKGHCFIDKANLNGETALEVLNAHIISRQICKDEDSLKNMKARFNCEPPNPRFESFRGHFTLETNGPVEEFSVDAKLLLMRETNLRNTKYIYGLVCYTGNDTKIQRSNASDKPKAKQSAIVRMVNKFLRIMFLLQMIVCLVGGLGAGLWARYYRYSAWYLELDGESPALGGVYAFFTWFILVSQMVPISLIVSMEIVKFVQSRFIQTDVTLYHKPINKPAKCNTSTIHDDLGLVDYIFSDKTGTLTQNKMEFRYASLPCGEFGSKETDIAKAVKTKKAEQEAREKGNYEPPEPVPWTKLLTPYVANSEEIDADKCEQKCSCMSKLWSHPSGHNRRFLERLALSQSQEALQANQFSDQEKLQLLAALWGSKPVAMTDEDYEVQRLFTRKFMIHMALSNTVKPFEDEGVLKYQAESAEELAMVNWARSLGFTKLSQNPTVLQIEEFGTNLQPVNENKATETYQHLATFGFTSQRARVSVLYQSVEDNSVIMFTKGADSVLLPLIRQQSNEALLLNLRECANNGLRTLVCAEAVLDSQWWEGRKAEYLDVTSRDESPNSQGHSGGKCNKALCEKCAVHNFFEKCEKDAQLAYVGCMGLEDQLQALVPETIKDCLRAGIKVWMITGDKLEAAKNIGLACNLIDPDMQPSVRPEMSVEECLVAFRDSRLIEITGQWAALTKSSDDIKKLFDMFDSDKNGVLDYDELDMCLRTLNFSHDSQRVQELFKQIDTDRNGSIDELEFVNLMTSLKLSMFEAVSFDVDSGINKYKAIENHGQNPISLLVNKDAFQVMFPHKEKAAAGPNSSVKPAEATPESDLEALRTKFFWLAAHSKSVVFARAEPAMKKRMVTEIMARVPNVTTLAIGDGANDTDMIKAAHVGVGIAGVEGTAAVNSADYAVGTFRMLHTLLLVHGFWNHQRIASLVLFIFYKAILLALVAWFFCFFSGYSGQQFYNDPPYQLVNVVFTAMPVMAMAIFNQILPRATLENNPSVYREGKGSFFGPRLFTFCVFIAVVHSVIIYFIPYAAMGGTNTNDVYERYGGKTEDLFYQSTVAFICVAMLPNLTIVFLMNTITIIHIVVIFLSWASIFLFVYIFSIVRSYNPQLYGTVARIYASDTSWLVMIITCAIPVMLDLVWRALRREFQPSFIDVLQERLQKARKEKKHQGDYEASSASVGSESKPPQSNGSVLPASMSVVASLQDDREWQKRTATIQRDASGSIAPSTNLPISNQLRSRLIVTMLKFQNLAGSLYESAANSKYQTHDAMTGAPSAKSTSLSTHRLPEVPVLSPGLIHRSTNSSVHPTPTEMKTDEDGDFDADGGGDRARGESLGVNFYV